MFNRVMQDGSMELMLPLLLHKTTAYKDKVSNPQKLNVAVLSTAVYGMLGEVENESSGKFERESACSPLSFLGVLMTCSYLFS